MQIINILLLVILAIALVALHKYGEYYDKRFGKCSTKFVIGQLIIVIGILIAIIITQFLLK